MVERVPPHIRAMAELELRRRRAEVESQLSKEDRDIPEDMTFREWCESLAKKGMKVDGKPFRLDNRPAMIPLYDAVPTTREEARNQVLVVQKATQLGASIWESLAAIYLSIKWEPITTGMFVPSQAVAIHKSEHRFMRIVRSAPMLYKILTTGRDQQGNPKFVGEGNVMTRKIKESLLLFLWTTGKVTTESVPMDVVTLDEQQEMTLDQIDKVRARTGDSDIAYTMMLSTANMPDLDINFWYQLGTQEVWHTECPHCKAMSDLSDPAGIFPHRSIAYNTGQFPDAPMSEYVWICPACNGVIKDPQIGRYVAQRSREAAGNIRSFLLPRTISPKLTPRAMIEAWGRAKSGDQKKSFYNRTLARPYIDADQLPVTMDTCNACVEAGRLAGIKWEKSGNDCVMGIDQMGSFNAVIIKRRLPDNRQAVVHVEAIFNDDPFERCSELMKQYGVSVCVVEQLPNVNDARKFANRHKGRVFLAGYADLRDDQMVWGDSLTRSERKTNEEDRSRYMVTLNQYKAMQTALYRIRDHVCLFPDPDLLIQDVLDNGVTKRIPILRDWVFMHFTKTALVVEDDPDTRKLKAKVQKVGLDPHYAFSNMLCDVAWARSHGTSTFIIPDSGTKDSEMTKRAEDMNLHGLPTAVASMIELNPTPVGEVCGACTAFKDGRCTERGFMVRPVDPGCDMFIEAEG